MTQAQIEDIYRRLDSLTAEVNSLKLLTGTIGTTQVALTQILNTQSTHTQVLNNHTELLNAHTTDLTQINTKLDRILEILGDRNGGSGL